VGCDASSPYLVNWNSTTVANGDHSVIARCRDNTNELTSSAAIPFTVANVTADTTPPVTVITNPTPASVVGALPINATCTDNIGCTEVDFIAGGVLIGTDTVTTPRTAFTITWNTEGLTPGVYLVTAVGKDNAGNTHTSAPITVIVVAAYPTLEDATICEVPATCGEAARVTNVVKNNAANEFRVLAKFDLTSYVGGVTDAVITFNVSGFAAASNVQLYAAASDAWSEDTVTWANAPPLGAEIHALGINAKGDISFNVTSLVASTIAGDNILSVILRDKNDTGLAFHFDSKEQGTMAPTLSITGTAGDLTAPAPVSLGLSGLVNGQYENRTIEWTATCADNLRVHRVQLFHGATAICSPDTTIPYGGACDTGYGTDVSGNMTSRCYDYGGNSTASAAQAVTVDVTAPAITNMSAVAASPTTIELSWASVETGSGINGTYKVNWCTPTPCTPTQQATTAATSYTATLTPGSTYNFSVAATDFMGLTGTSSVVTASLNDLVAWFRLEAGALGTDSSRLANNGTVNGNTVSVPGIVGNAAQFDGTGDWISIPNHAQYATPTNLSVSALVNCNGVCGLTDMIAAKNDGTNQSWMFRVDNTNINFLEPIIWDVAATFRVEAGGGWATAAGWHHVVFTYDGANIRLYIDRILRGTTPRIGVINTTVAPMGIGGDRAVTTAWMTGLIDEVKVFNKALSLADVTSMYDDYFFVEAPSSLETVPLYDTEQVNLRWTLPTTQSATGFRIYRDAVQIADVPGTTAAYQDKTVAASTPYTYTMRAYGPPGLSVPLAAAPITTYPTYTPLPPPDYFPFGTYLYINSLPEGLIWGQPGFVASAAPYAQSMADAGIDYVVVNGFASDRQITEAIQLFSPHGIKISPWRATASLLLEADITTSAFKSEYATKRLKVGPEITPWIGNPNIAGWYPKEEYLASEIEGTRQFASLFRAADPTRHLITEMKEEVVFAQENPPIFDVNIIGGYTFKYQPSNASFPNLNYALELFADHTTQPMLTELLTKDRLVRYWALIQGASFFTTYAASSSTITGVKAILTEAEMFAQGWTYNATADTWSLMINYNMPPNATRASAWMAVALGAKGIVSWHYLGRPGPHPPAATLIANLPLGWGEFADTIAEMKPHTDLLLNLTLQGTALATSPDSYVYLKSHHDTANNLDFIVVVNFRLTTDVPDWIKTYSVDAQGNLSGYTPATTRTDITIDPVGADNIFDLETGLIAGAAGAPIDLTLAPGEGKIYLIGNSTEFSTYQTVYGG
jgi:hypothetical protein